MAGCRMPMMTRLHFMTAALARLLFALPPIVLPSSFAAAVPAGIYQGQPAGSYTHRGTGFNFPTRAGEFERVAVTEFNAEATDVSAGYNLTNRGQELAVTVYVYPALPSTLLRSQRATDAAQDRSCSDQFAGVKADIEHAHPGARLILQERTASPSPSYHGRGWRAVYAFQGNFQGTEQPLQSEAYLYCYVGGDWLIAYRATAPKAVKYASSLDRLMRDLAWPGKANSSSR